MFSGVVASLSARRAWIEMAMLVLAQLVPSVALRKESVDRNWQSIETPDSVSIVALRKESVDRNSKTLVKTILPVMHWSLSARRAWIEICSYTPI